MYQWQDGLGVVILRLRELKRVYLGSVFFFGVGCTVQNSYFKVTGVACLSDLLMCELL